MRSNLDHEFVSALKEYQAREAISIAEMARRLGVSPPYVSRLFSDKYDGSTTFKTASELLERLGIEVHVEYSFQGSPEKMSA